MAVGRVIRTVPRRNKVSHAVTTEIVNARIDTTMLIGCNNAGPRRQESSDVFKPNRTGLKINKFACANLRLLYSNLLAAFFL
jgi:hypothetical protein